jgi:signal transduction histidine kinase
LTSFTLSLFVWSRDPKNQVNIAYALLNFCLAVWILWDILSVTLSPADLATALLLSRLCYALAVFVPIFYLHFVYALVGIKRKVWLYSGYVLTLILFLSIFSKYFIKGIILGTAFNQPRLLVNGATLFDVFTILYFATAIIGVIEMIRAYPRAEGRRRRQIGYFILATFIAYSAGPIYFLSMFGIPVPPVDNLLLGFYTMLMAYAIVKQRFLDITVVISKTTARLITYGFYAGIYLGTVIFYFNFISAKPDFLLLLFTIAFGILGVETASATRLAIQTTTDKLFLRGKYDYYFELEHIGSDLSNCAGFEDLLRHLNNAFVNNLEVGHPRLFVPQDLWKKDKSPDYLAYDLISSQPTTEVIERRNPIIKFLSLENGVLEKGFNVPEEIRPHFNQRQVHLMIPCHFRNKLMGILALGDKLSQDDYTDEDLRLLKNIANQIAAALERGRAYEDLKEEVERSRAQLEISARLSSLGTLAAGVTHEIRNPLGVIQSKLELLPGKLDDKEFLMNLSEVLPRHIERIVGLINRLLFFARPEKKMTQKIKIAQILQDTIDLVDGEASRRNIKISREIKDFEVLGDFGQLSQVFLNIMLNAIQSMGAGGELKVSTSSHDNWVKASISDTGPGIAPENVEKIFDPFFTTRSSGTGLGLSIARRIVEEHKGEISVVSEPGRGATFTVKLPAY